MKPFRPPTVLLLVMMTTPALAQEEVFDMVIDAEAAVEQAVEDAIEDAADAAEGAALNLDALLGQAAVQALVQVELEADAKDDDQAEVQRLGDLPRDEVVSMLDAANYATRRRAEDHLLTDDTLGKEALQQLLKNSVSDEQHYRLLRIAEHHVLREAREREFGPRQQPGIAGNGLAPRDTAAIGFSYAPVLPGENPLDNQSGVTVIATMPGFPGHAYLRPGDVIIAIDANAAAHRPAHQEVTAWISWRIAMHRAGDPISFTVVRDGRTLRVSFKCAQSTALNRMYSTDGLKAANRSAPFEMLWQKARKDLTADLPEPRTLTPEP